MNRPAIRNDIDQVLLQQVNFLDQIHDSVISTTLDGIITSWNKGAERIFGYTRDEAVNKHILMLYSENFHSFLREELIPTLKTNVAHDAEVVMRRKSGEEFYAHLSLSMLYDEMGNAIGMVGYTIDINERVLTQKALAASERRFQQITSHIPGIVYQFKIDSQGKQSLPYMSPMAEKIIGITSQSIMDDISHICAIVHPEELSELKASILESYQNMTVWEWEGRIIHAGNEIRWLHGSSVPSHQEDGSVIWDGMLIDITDRKQIEQALIESEIWMRNIYNSLDEAVLVVSPDRRLININSAACNIFGYTEEEISNGSTAMFHVDEAHYMEFGKRINNAFEKGIAAHFDFESKRKNGEIFPTEHTVSQLKNTEGKVIGIISIVRDISERKKVESELNQHREHLEVLVEERTREIKIAHDEAERANKAKSEFLSRMSHELRTPLNAILGFSQLLAISPTETLSDDQADNVNEIQSAGAHLLTMVNEILDLSRIESGRLEVNVQSTELLSILKECVSQVQPMAKQREITITNGVTENWSVLADVTRLKQVLLNLLSNAIKYNSHAGSIIIDAIHLGSCIRVTVKDTGPGISEEEISQLFKPFERLQTNSDDVEGTGIGLALAKNLVKAMNGDIGVESQAGQGSTFWFELPTG